MNVGDEMVDQVDFTHQTLVWTTTLLRTSSLFGGQDFGIHQLSHRSYLLCFKLRACMG